MTHDFVSDFGDDEERRRRVVVRTRLRKPDQPVVVRHPKQLGREPDVVRGAVAMDARDRRSIAGDGVANFQAERVAASKYTAATAGAS
jgi:hypothetical protein